MSPSGGQVGPTEQERTLASNAMNQWQDYQRRWQPVQDHIASLTSDMGKADSWQRQEAEGKGNADVARSFAESVAARNASELARGINVGSTRFKLGAANSASAEAEAKGLAVASGNESIDKAYLANLGAIARIGQGIAGAAVGGQGVGAETGSRIAISGAQEQNAVTAQKYELGGFALGAVASPQGADAAKGIWSAGSDMFADTSMMPRTPTVTDTSGGTTTFWGK